MSRGTVIGVAAALGALAVACGAFGAHALRGRVPAADLEIWEVAVRYQMWHALALLLLAALGARSRLLGAAALCFLLGTLIFSGSLYLLVLTGPRWLGAVTPFGGALLIAGWVLLALGRGGATAPRQPL